MPKLIAVLALIVALFTPGPASAHPAAAELAGPAAGAGPAADAAGPAASAIPAAEAAGPGGGLAAGPEHTVTFVNRTGETIWVGSTVNYDSSVNFERLPTLADGEQGTVTIPENSWPGHWRGKFFARTGCTGESGSTFHCAVGDCGNLAQKCAINWEQPASLAEFNFDPADQWGAPWYNVSYVNAVSVPITIDTVNATPPWPGSTACSRAGCPEPLLDACPPDLLQRDATGRPYLCVNPNRDAETSYSRAITARCPKAYSWSRQDTVPGNQTVYNCPSCGGFTITFHAN